MLRRVLSGEPKPVMRVKKSGSSPTGLKRGENLKSRPPKYSREEIELLYKSGMSVMDIVRETGAHRGTISKILTERGLTDRRGPVPRTLCGKGLHDMAVHGRPVKGGGRYCAACKSERGKKQYQKSKRT